MLINGMLILKRHVLSSFAVSFAVIVSLIVSSFPAMMLHFVMNYGN